MNYQQRRRFSIVPAAFAVLATVGTLALAVVAPASMAPRDTEPTALARNQLPVVLYRVDVVGVRPALTSDAHVNETARKAS